MKINYVNYGQRVDIADLSDTEFDFSCTYEKEFDFSLCARVNDYEYNRSMTKVDLKYLRENCKRILEATEGAL
jgi:hypothetical protein